MQNLSQLQHFKLVAQEGSFARAAELAHITQPALSNSIRSLETRLGMELFERSERPVRLTAAGKAILGQVDALLFEAQNLDQLLDNLTTGEGGHIRLGMAAVFSTSLGGPIIAEWHEANPNVTLDLVVQETDELLIGLRDETFDIIVGDTRNLGEDIDDLDLINLPPLSGGAFCRSEHPILNIRQPQPADLARYRFASPHVPEIVIRNFAKFLGRDDREKQPLITIMSQNIAALRDAVAESDLILLTTAGTVRNSLALGILKRIPVELGIDGVWSIATRKGRVHHPAIPGLFNKIIETSRREHERCLAPYVGQMGGIRS